ncbi:MAG: hypothetical protein DRI56_08965 [Chloroflexota bacterium]|nr:MAG: hypothetical protein DRI56_08965 [Chloroflexota bacterium]
MTINQQLLEIHQNFEKGYHSHIDYGEWRVATLCYIDELAPENIETIERHNETDEVFVLLQGHCILFIGEGDNEITAIHPADMEPQKLYNVKKGVYHTHTLSRDALLLIIENRDTSLANSDSLRLKNKDRQQLLEAVKTLW